MAISDELKKQVDPNNESCCEHCLGSLCKYWAMSKGYQIISGPSDEPAYRKQDEKAYAKINYYSEDEIGNREFNLLYFMANTEVEAVIKASEYVLREINENR